jgi:hypothetical protein
MFAGLSLLFWGLTLKKRKTKKNAASSCFDKNNQECLSCKDIREEKESCDTNRKKINP